PGFGGQSFMHDQLEKIREVRTMIDATSKNIHLEVDGGIAVDTCELVKSAGANMLVAGTAVFKAKDGMASAIATLKK
ncbi:MAG: ribulose-phosphate 3-epimerase, partial [Lentisphaeria bacterium]